MKLTNKVRRSLNAALRLRDMQSQNESLRRDSDFKSDVLKAHNIQVIQSDQPVTAGGGKVVFDAERGTESYPEWLAWGWQWLVKMGLSVSVAVRSAVWMKYVIVAGLLLFVVNWFLPNRNKLWRF